MLDKEYIVFCDESEKAGKYYSNFYGGIIIGSSQYQRITDKLNQLKQNRNLFSEMKWEKVTELYLPRYIDFVKCFFEEVVAGNIRVRILFRQNARKPVGLTPEDKEMEYFKLYYQFIKHGFGLYHAGQTDNPIRLRLYFDQFPDTKEKIERFKGYLFALQKAKEFRKAQIHIDRQDITEVRSHDHVLLQCLDIILGSMAFRLNDKHKEKAPGQRMRGKKTRAKEALYRFILGEICKLRPRFNIGVSTGLDDDITNHWKGPYRHWLFEPKDHEYDETLTKPDAGRNWSK